jgi:hypothetical protein
LLIRPPPPPIDRESSSLSIHKNSQWKTGFIGGDYRRLDGDGAAGRNLDARTAFFYMATVNTPEIRVESLTVTDLVEHTAPS